MLAGNGIVNLGQVKPNFYATLQAVEDDGYVNVKSKPRLSTMNGKEATLTLGETRYFLQERTTLQGSNNPISLQERRFESVNADFSIKILPVISGTNLNKNSKTSFYADQIAASVPKGIQFSVLDIFPLIEKQNNFQENQLQEFKQNIILIKGLSKSSTVYNQWVRKLKKLDWIKTVDHLDYKDVDRNNAEFELRLGI